MTNLLLINVEQGSLSTYERAPPHLSNGVRRLCRVTLSAEDADRIRKGIDSFDRAQLEHVRTVPADYVPDPTPPASEPRAA